MTGLTRDRVRSCLDACVYSSLAYVPVERIRCTHTLSKRREMTSFELLRSYDGLARDVQAHLLLAEEDRELVVAFRGTMNVRDLLDVFDLRPSSTRVEARGERVADVHRGFRNQFRAIEPLLTRDLGCARRTETGGRPVSVRFVGHSMGGALAMLAAAHYSSRFPAWEMRSETFGCPPFADHRFASVMRDLDHVVVVHEDDVVPLIPMHPSYVHMPNTFTLAADGTSCRCDEGSLEEKITCAAFVRKALGYGSYQVLVRNHGLMAYTTALKACAIALDGSDP